MWICGRCGTECHRTECRSCPHARVFYERSKPSDPFIMTANEEREAANRARLAAEIALAECEGVDLRPGRKPHRSGGHRRA